MRFPGCAISLILVLILSAPVSQATAQRLPVCNTREMVRNGNRITIGFQQLANTFNRNLAANRSTFSDLHLSSEGGNKLRVSGNNNGKPVSIVGPLQPAEGGNVVLRADQIVQNGSPEKGLMGLFGKELSDYFKNTPSVNARGDNILIRPDLLLNLSGRVTGVSLDNSGVTLQFASQPCR